MRVIRTAFQNFWGQFFNRSTNLPAPRPIQAFQEGFAMVRDSQGRPAIPEFPYITYQLVRPDFMDFTIVTANIWDRNPGNPGFMGLIDDVLAQIAEKIPVGGTIVNVDEDGAMWFLRSNPFIQYLDDPEDQFVTRGIIRIIISNYIK